MKKFDPTDTTNENIKYALEIHRHLANTAAEMKRIGKITSKHNESIAEVIKEHQTVQGFLSDYFHNMEDTSETSVMYMDELLNRRKLAMNELDEDGEKIEIETIDLGIDYIREEFNEGKDFPLSTFMTLLAGSGVGKSDYLYKIANSLLMQHYKVLLCSYEFGENRLGELLACEEEGGKDRLREARMAGFSKNLAISYYARSAESLGNIIDIAHAEGVKAILIDSFGEIERDRSEYELQQAVAMMLNKKSNDYGMFIALIAQTKAGETHGEYTSRGGTDLIYKADISIHIKKVKAEDTSGDRIVHLFKNREVDLNGKTIVTKYTPDTRSVDFKCDYADIDASTDKPIRTLKGWRK